MDSLYQLLRDIKKQKRIALADLFLALFTVCFPIIAIGMYVKNLPGRGVFAFLSLFCIGAFVLRNRKTQKHPEQPYQLSLGKLGMESIRLALHTEEILPNCCAAFFTDNGCRIRVLLQWVEEFDKDALNKVRKMANAAINKKYCVPQEVSLYEGAKMVRVNVVICSRMSPELSGWVAADTEQMLSRVEGIVRAGIALDRQMLLLPRCGSDLDYGQARKYEAAVQMLVNHLCQDNQDING